MKKILVIDDDRSICKTLELHLGKEYRICTAYSGSDGLKLVEAESPDIVILDIRLPDMDGIALLKRIREIDKDIYVIMITAFHDMDTTIMAMQAGAFEYIPKPIHIDELDLAIKKAIHTQNLHKRLDDLLAEVYEEYQVDKIIGKSKTMEEIFKIIGIASQSKVTVLIQGESGTGKELIARAIHHNSPDKNKPFVSVNCSALVETLLESELFGHEKGAFTGAIYKKQGKFELASGGTIFLDEISEMSPALQVKLLRVLQERSFERVGGKDTIKTDMRVIAATNRNLYERVKRELFREDLYYRLKVVTIDVPPLRERREDIPLLVKHLLNKANKELHKDVRKIPDGVMDILVNYEWKGNVRELENLITRAVLLARGDVLLEEYLPPLICETCEVKEGRKATPVRNLDEVEKEEISKALKFTGWNKGRACALLGLTRPRLERKIKKYGLSPLG